MKIAGTDDDLPPSHHNRFQRGVRPTGNGRSAVIGSASLPRMQNDMATQIHSVEQDAYSSVLRAFKAQSDAITWVTFTFCMHTLESSLINKSRFESHS